MRICPICNKTFEDTVGVCPEHRVLTEEVSDAKTLALDLSAAPSLTSAPTGLRPPAPLPRAIPGAPDEEIRTTIGTPGFGSSGGDSSSGSDSSSGADAPGGGDTPSSGLMAAPKTVQASGSGAPKSLEPSMLSSSPPPAAAPQNPAPKQKAQSASTEVDDVAAGDVLSDRYELNRLIGSGGMGDVFDATDRKIQKRVAVKVLKRKYSVRKKIVERFRREALSATRIGHPNVIDVTDFDQAENGQMYLVMELLEGDSLAGLLKSHGRLTLERSAHIFRQMAAALQAAHEKGIIHRDVKPGNVVLTDRGTDGSFAKVLDFGIAHIKQAEDEEARRLTRVGAILGTPDYMSPEQARGDPLDARTDIYASGVILYEMLTGKPPFHADTYMGVMAKHMFEPPKPMTEQVPDLQLPPELEQVLLKSLAKKAEDRFSSMQEFVAALDAAMVVHGVDTRKHQKLSVENALAYRKSQQQTSVRPSAPSGSSVSSAPTAATAQAPAPVPVAVHVAHAPTPKWILPVAITVVAVAAAVGALIIAGMQNRGEGEGPDRRAVADQPDKSKGKEKGTDDDGDVATALVTASAVAATAVPPPVTAAPATGKVKRPKTAGDKGPKWATVRLESEPSSTVLEGSKVICITPCLGKFENPSAGRMIDFVKADHKTISRKIIPLTETVVSVKLKRTKSLEPATSSGKSPGLIRPE